MKVKLVFYLGGLCLACQGCSPLATVVRTSIIQPLMYNRGLNEIIDCKRNQKLAESTWLEFTSHSPTVYSSDFEKGFKEGFVDYLFWGGTGAPPPVPPRCYWTAKYESAEGHQAIADWFAGFRKGAESARETGYRKLVVVPASTCLPSMLPETSSSPSSDSTAGQGSSSGSGTGSEEALPPPRPVPVPTNPAPAAPPQTGPRLPDASSSRPQGVLPVPEEASRKTNSSKAVRLAPQAAAESSAGASEADSDQLLTILKDSWNPFQRAWAAQQLARQDLGVHPPLCQALSTAAQEDPAALVQAVCRKLLADAEIPSPSGFPTLQSSDPQVHGAAKADEPTLGRMSAN